MTLAEKWSAHLPDTGAAPEARALRAEAEAACARVLAASNSYQHVAAQRQLQRVTDELTETKEQVAARIRELDEQADEARRRQRRAREREGEAHRT